MVASFVISLADDEKRWIASSGRTLDSARFFCFLCSGNRPFVEIKSDRHWRHRFESRTEFIGKLIFPSSRICSNRIKWKKMLNDKPIKWFLSFRNHWRWTELWQLAQKHQNQFVFWLISRLFTGFNIYFLCDLPHKMRPFSVWLHRPDNANQLIWLHDFSVWIFIKSDGQLLWSFVLSFEFHFDCVRQAFPFLPLNHIVFIERMANIYIAVDFISHNKVGIFNKER